MMPLFIMGHWARYGAISVCILGLMCAMHVLGTVRPPIRESFADSKNAYDRSLFRGRARRRSAINKIYDAFYSSVYQQLIHRHMQSRIKYEVTNVIDTAALEKYPNATVLDLGCGVGSHLVAMSARLHDAKLIGVDQSDAMLKRAQTNAQENGITPIRWIQGDITNPALFGRSSVSHITLFYFTIYYLKDLTKALDCWSYWLKQGGYLVVHVVDPKRFDPVLDAASPFVGHSIQAYSTTRRTESTVHFRNFVYRSFFDYDAKRNNAAFEEHFEFKTNPNKRIQRHKLYMFSADEFAARCKKRGFKLVQSVHLLKIGYGFEYILYFQK